MRESSKASLCGIVSALAVVIMLSTYLSPLLVYTAPPFAGLLLLIIVNELGYKWSLGSYVTISLLSVFLIADKESAVFFTFFFGYYPILVVFLNKTVKIKALCIILKFLIFNASCIMSLLLSSFFFGIDGDDILSEGALYLVIFVFLLNVFFFIYDLLIVRLQLLYRIKLRKTIKKIFNIK